MALQGRSHEILSGQVYISVTRAKRAKILSHAHFIRHRSPCPYRSESEKLDFAHQWNVGKPSQRISAVDNHRISQVHQSRSSKRSRLVYCARAASGWCSKKWSGKYLPT